MNAVLRFAPAAARIFLGLVFFVFGLNGFLGFIPQPPLPEPAQALMGAFAASGYMFPFIKATEVLVGALLLSNRFIPLALIVLAPVNLHIAAFHLALAPANLGLTVMLLAAHLYLGWSYRDSFRAVLAARAAPRTGEASAQGRAVTA
jgi:uncharacterized membrane protein YphA (DoxX/SURF4 family)